MIFNNKQRNIIIVGVLLFVLMGIFPPWTYTLNGVPTKPAGYDLIVLPPEPEINANAHFGVKIDVSRLIVQWFVLAVTTGLGVLVFREK